jgi:hypothetical protein
MSNKGPSCKKRAQNLRITIRTSTVLKDLENYFVFVSPKGVSPLSFSKLPSPSKWIHAFPNSDQGGSYCPVLNGDSVRSSASHIPSPNDEL